MIGQQPITIFLSSSLHSPETFLPLFSCLISFHFDLLPCYISSPLLFPPLLSSLLSGPAVMSIEAGGINGWWKYAHAPFGMETFGYVHIFILTHVHTNTASHSLTLSLSLTHSLTHSLTLFLPFYILLLTYLILSNLHSMSAPAPSIYNLFGFSIPNLCLRAREVVAFYKEKGAPSLLKYPRFPKLGSLAGH